MPLEANTTSQLSPYIENLLGERPSNWGVNIRETICYTPEITSVAKAASLRSIKEASVSHKRSRSPQDSGIEGQWAEGGVDVELNDKWESQKHSSGVVIRSNYQERRKGEGPSPLTLWSSRSTTAEEGRGNIVNVEELIYKRQRGEDSPEDALSAHTNKDPYASYHSDLTTTTTAESSEAQGAFCLSAVESGASEFSHLAIAKDIATTWEDNESAHQYCHSLSSRATTRLVSSVRASELQLQNSTSGNMAAGSAIAATGSSSSMYCINQSNHLSQQSSAAAASSISLGQQSNHRCLSGDPSQCAVCYLKQHRNSVETLGCYQITSVHQGPLYRLPRPPTARAAIMLYPFPPVGPQFLPELRHSHHQALFVEFAKIETDPVRIQLGHFIVEHCTRSIPDEYFRSEISFDPRVISDFVDQIIIAVEIFGEQARYNSGREGIPSDINEVYISKWLQQKQHLLKPIEILHYRRQQKSIADKNIIPSNSSFNFQTFAPTEQIDSRDMKKTCSRSTHTQDKNLECDKWNNNISLNHKRRGAGRFNKTRRKIGVSLGEELDHLGVPRIIHYENLRLAIANRGLVVQLPSHSNSASRSNGSSIYPSRFGSSPMKRSLFNLLIAGRGDTRRSRLVSHSNDLSSTGITMGRDCIPDFVVEALGYGANCGGNHHLIPKVCAVSLEDSPYGVEMLLFYRGMPCNKRVPSSKRFLPPPKSMQPPGSTQFERLIRSPCGELANAEGQKGLYADRSCYSLTGEGISSSNDWRQAIPSFHGNSAFGNSELQQPTSLNENDHSLFDGERLEKVTKRVPSDGDIVYSEEEHHETLPAARMKSPEREEANISSSPLTEKRQSSWWLGPECKPSGSLQVEGALNEEGSSPCFFFNSSLSVQEKSQNWEDGNPSRDHVSMFESSTLPLNDFLFRNGDPEELKKDFQSDSHWCCSNI